MRLLIGLAFVLLAPGLASADIESRTSASSQTGGNVVGPGGKVTTGGASASVSTSNVSGHSSSSFYIKTDANGVVHEESYTSHSSDASVSVQATPTSTIVETSKGLSGTVERAVVPAAPARMHTEQKQTVQASSSVSATVSATSTLTPTSTPTEAVGLGTRIILSIQNFFAGVFGWFK